MRVNAFGGGFDFGHLPVGDIERIEVVARPAERAVRRGRDRRRRPDRRRAAEARRASTPSSKAAARRRAHLGAAAGSRGAWTFGGGADTAAATASPGPPRPAARRVTNDDDHLRARVGLDRLAAAGRRRRAGHRRHRPRRARLPRAVRQQPDWRVRGRRSRGARHERHAPDSARGSSIRGRRACGSGSRRTTRIWPSSFAERVRPLDERHAPVRGARPGRPRAHRAARRVGRRAASCASVARAPTSPATRATPFAHPAGHRRRLRRAPLRTGGAGCAITGGAAARSHLARRRARQRLRLPAARRPSPTQTIDSLNPKIAVSYLFSAPGAANTTRLHASAGTGIRPPDAFEIAFTDNPDLKPEAAAAWTPASNSGSRPAARRRRDRVLQPLRRSARHGRTGRCATRAGT